MTSEETPGTESVRVPRVRVRTRTRYRDDIRRRRHILYRVILSGRAASQLHAPAVSLHPASLHLGSLRRRSVSSLASVVGGVEFPLYPSADEVLARGEMMRVV